MKRIKQALLRFMMGRYGSDKLNMWILGTGFICSILSMFIPVAGLALSTCSTVLLIWAILAFFIIRNNRKG